MVVGLGGGGGRADAKLEGVNKTKMCDRLNLKIGPLLKR